MTPFKADFVYFVPCDIPMNKVGNEKCAVGVGTCTTTGNTILIPGFGYYMPQATVHLTRPQSFYKQLMELGD